MSNEVHSFHQAAQPTEHRRNVGVFAAMVGSTAQATLLWYDGFAIGDDDGAGPNYVAGNIAGQLGGSDAGAGGLGSLTMGRAIRTRGSA